MSSERTPIESSHFSAVSSHCSWKACHTSSPGGMKSRSRSVTVSACGGAAVGFSQGNSFTSGRPSCASGRATRKWQPSANSSPPPRHWPAMAPIMAELMRRKLFTVMPVVAVLTMLFRG